jgi:predicted ester cyclase
MKFFKACLGAALCLSLAALATLSAAVHAEPRIQCDDNPENLSTYLTMHKVLFMERDTSRVTDFYADEIISHNNDLGGGAGFRLVTPAEMAKRWDFSRERDPDRVLEDELILCAGDFVVVRTLVKSHFIRPIAGIEPTGEAFEFTATDTYRFEDGKVVERWGNNDMAHVYQQLGFKISRD